MSAAVPRAMMTLATCCLEGSRPEWAQAMAAEFETAVQDGGGWSFSAGCLIAAWRDLPARVGGRLLLARYMVACGFIIPIAALLLATAFDPGQAGRGSLINDGNRAAAPVLAQVTMAIGVLRLAAAWAMLDRNWTRMAALERLSVAATITLAVLAGLSLLDAACAVLPAAALVVEIAALAALARVHDPITPGCDA